jgi:hypothetical protein
MNVKQTPRASSQAKIGSVATTVHNDRSGADGCGGAVVVMTVLPSLARR